MAGGRQFYLPLKAFKSVQEFKDRVQEYYDECDRTGKVKTICGLCVAIRTNRSTLLSWQDEEGHLYRYIDPEIRHGIAEAITEAKAYIEAEYEQYLFNNNSVRGASFTLKNNYMWADKQEIEQTNKVIEVKLED